MRFHYTGIRIRDLDRSIEFYTQVMGMKLIHRSKIPSVGGEIAVLNSPGSEQVLELNFYEDSSKYNTPYVVGEGLDHLGFQVEDLEKTLSKFSKIGIEPFVEVDSGGLGKYVYVKDPDGIWLEIYQMDE
jgi:lactoylglutathione lyase